MKQYLTNCGKIDKANQFYTEFQLNLLDSSYNRIPKLVESDVSYTKSTVVTQELHDLLLNTADLNGVYSFSKENAVKLFTRNIYDAHWSMIKFLNNHPDVLLIPHDEENLKHPILNDVYLTILNKKLEVSFNSHQNCYAFMADDVYYYVKNDQDVYKNVAALITEIKQEETILFALEGQSNYALEHFIGDTFSSEFFSEFATASLCNHYNTKNLSEILKLAINEKEKSLLPIDYNNNSFWDMESKDSYYVLSFMHIKLNNQYHLFAVLENELDSKVVATLFDVKEKFSDLSMMYKEWLSEQSKKYHINTYKATSLM